MDDLTKLIATIRNDALKTFIESTSEAYRKLEQDVGALPENALKRWNDGLTAVIEAANR